MGVKTGVKSTVKFNVRFDSEIVIFNTVKFNGVYFYVKIVITYELYRCTELNLYICTVCTSRGPARRKAAFLPCTKNWYTVPTGQTAKPWLFPLRRR